MTSIDAATFEEAIEIIDVYFDKLLLGLQKTKPNDRSAQDRRWAIVITDVEKAWAMYQAWFMSDKE